MKHEVYKLFRQRKDGSLGPLFINRKQVVPVGSWLQAELLPTKGFSVRKGWHCCYTPHAPHLKKDLKSGEKRVWARCLVEGVVEFERPEAQGGKWVLADKLKVVEVIG